MKRRLRASRALALALLVPVLAVACGKPVDESALRAVSRAAAEVQDAETFRMSFSMTMSGIPDAPSGSITMSGRGAFDYRRQAGRMTMDMGSMLGSLAPPGSTRVDVIVDGLVMYMRMPFLTRLIPGGRPWLELDLEEAGRQAGVDLAALSQVGQSDPTQYLTYLSGASEDVREVNRQPIDGVATTHYHAELDLGWVLEQAPAAVRERAQASIEQLQEMLADDTMPVDVWIDGRGLPRRMSTSYEMKVPDSEDTFDVRYSMEIGDYGTRVRVKRPPASQVTDLIQLLQQAGAGAGL
jgi:hypothetical protein